MVGVVGLLTVGEGESKKWRVSRFYNRGWHLVVPKSYLPKGQPRSTRNEFPIRASEILENI